MSKQPSKKPLRKGFVSPKPPVKPRPKRSKQVPSKRAAPGKK